AAAARAATHAAARARAVAGPDAVALRVRRAALAFAGADAAALAAAGARPLAGGLARDFALDATLAAARPRARPDEAALGAHHRHVGRDVRVALGDAVGHRAHVDRADGRRVDHFERRARGQRGVDDRLDLGAER